MNGKEPNNNNENEIKVDTAINFAGMKLKNPVFTVSGTCGYADELDEYFDMSALGGFITKSITPEPRLGNPTPRVVETDSGMLNAIGLANVGLERFISEKIPIIDKMDLPVLVNVAGWTIEDYMTVINKLAKQKAIAGFELNISCPNVKKGGITFGTDPGQIEKITKKAKKLTPEKPLVVKLTPNVTDITATAQAAVNGGADALSLVNTFTAMAIDIKKQKTVLANKTGGLSGPAIKPIALHMVNRVYETVAKKHNIPILGLGGIRTANDAVEFMLAGATAVGVGTANFIEPACCLDIADGIKKYCRKKQFNSVAQLTGSLQ